MCTESPIPGRFHLGDHMELTQELRHKAARGENLTAGDVLEAASVIEELEAKVLNLTQRLDQRNAQVEVLKNMNTLAFEAASSARTIDQITEDVTAEGTKRDSSLYNAFEIRQFVFALRHEQSRRADRDLSYQELDTYANADIGVDAMIEAIDEADVRPFSFKDVAELLEMYRNLSVASLTRPVKKSVREVFQLLKAHPTAHFYGEELRMIRQWGVDHERDRNIIKARLGRAFTDPVGYMDTRFDLMLSKATKRQLLDGRVLTAQAYQHAVFTRPDFLQIKPDWVLHDGKTQFHAGEHFHTRACDGMWWCGTHFNDLTGHQLMNVLETALGELRLLYIHFPNGVNNDEADTATSAS